MVICLEQGADLHMVQLMPLPLTVSCFSKIQTGFTFLVPAHPGSPGQRAVKRACGRDCVYGTIVALDVFTDDLYASSRADVGVAVDENVVLSHARVRGRLGRGEGQRRLRVSHLRHRVDYLHTNSASPHLSPNNLCILSYIIKHTHTTV